MKFKCLFCGKEVVENTLQVSGYCDECNLAFEYAQITLEELRKVGIK